MKTKSLILFFVLAGLLLSACAPAGPSASEAPPSASNESEPEAATVTPAQVKEPTAAPQEALSLSVSETDPCAYIDGEAAADALGAAVDEPTRAEDARLASCTYIATPGERFITIATYDADQARRLLLDEIAQLEAGCSLELGTAPDDPTPLPPEIEAMRGQSILALFVSDLELQQSCGGSYQLHEDLGENVYSYVLPFLRGAIVGIAGEDMFVTFVVGDTEATQEEALDTALQLVAAAFEE